MARALIDRFGGVPALARKLGHPWETTVRAWYRVDSIHHKHIDTLRDLAKEEGVEFSRADLLPDEKC